jgi:hypothetical protein
MIPTVGCSVTILPPFSAFFPGTYTVTTIFDPAGGSDLTTCLLNDSDSNPVVSAFSFIHLQVVS